MQLSSVFAYFGLPDTVGTQTCQIGWYYTCSCHRHLYISVYRIQLARSESLFNHWSEEIQIYAWYMNSGLGQDGLLEQFGRKDVYQKWCVLLSESSFNHCRNACFWQSALCVIHEGGTRRVMWEINWVRLKLVLLKLTIREDKSQILARRSVLVYYSYVVNVTSFVFWTWRCDATHIFACVRKVFLVKKVFRAYCDIGVGSYSAFELIVGVMNGINSTIILCSMSLVAS